MLLLVGLGNPGKDYSSNRHNIGAMAVDEIIHAYGLGATKKRIRPPGLFVDGLIDQTKVKILKPLTYMNESGDAVGRTMRYWRLETKRIFVFHDDIDLAPGKVRTKFGGGHAGHNGVRNIENHVGNKFWRVRIGVGHPGEKKRVKKHVLNNFAKSDQKWVKETLAAISKSVPILLRGNDSAFMTKIALLQQLAKGKHQKPKENRITVLQKDK